MGTDMNKPFKSGFVALVGRPNVGKSSLLNTFIGQKITITSEKPQTTRNQIRGILTGDHYQIIWLDTPGLHRPLHQLGAKMNEKTQAALSGVDLILWVLDAGKGLTAGDQKIAARLQHSAVPVYVVWNKIDLEAADQRITPLAEFEKSFAVSAHSRAGIEELLAGIVEQLPEGPLYYPEDMVTDHPERYLVGELLREQILTHTADEVPHSVAVQVEQMREQEVGPMVIDAVIYVERDSQKGIIIGAKGERLKGIGRDARQNIEALLDTRVFLNLWVKVRKNWRNHAASLKEFGYGDDQN